VKRGENPHRIPWYCPLMICGRGVPYRDINTNGSALSETKAAEMPGINKILPNEKGLKTSNSE